MELYVKPLEGRGADGNKERVLSPEEHRRIFTNVGAIFQLHKDHLLPALEEACIETAPEEHGLKGRIGRAFLQFAPFLKLYGIYATSFEASAKLIERYESDKVDGNGAKLNRASVRRYKEVVARARRDTRHTQLNLQAWMLLPLQRLMRYPLLLKNLLEVTVDGHPDEFELEKALTEVEKR
ncbi:Dbl homology domain-containing protein [Gonapodya prolifera JEL478]|uniref:Dbl homology domain-containing protein n=1 Tax=Gonapodya prolifera (strain JEL478) TaxID=1344416 RepID=A0A139A9W0_GONPJ|nr:Dbl homology domain-containing protein [Gonapodya prolifera JEL478]|eukprot:KXS13632.1 Dbl homology domain-containing protein [Gonapodya prolifera JEL478]